MVPTVEQIEEYLESLEELLFSSLSLATPDLPNFREAVNRLWLDISRYGPSGISSFPDVRIPGIGNFQVPPPPPPPPQMSFFEKSINWAGSHPWKASGVALGVTGAGLLIGYRMIQMKDAKIVKVKTATKEKRQAVVLLGGDSPLAQPLIFELEKQGYIVVVSVSTPEAVDELEHKCHGFVRALVLDPHEPTTIEIFLRSLMSTLSRRFPINAPGDPHVSPSSMPYIHSVISLLSLPSTRLPLAPLEHISLSSSYLPYLSATHVVPLQIIQALLPLMRTTPARARDMAGRIKHSRKSIVVCLPAADVRVGLPFSSVQAMSAAATLRGIEVLRREINMAAQTDQTQSMKDLKVVVVEVGAVHTSASSMPAPPPDLYGTMHDWTPSERLTYGPAFASISREPATYPSYWKTLTTIFNQRFPYGMPRRPSDVVSFVDTIVGVVSGRRVANIFGNKVDLGNFGSWLHPERISVGSGAMTYALASHLPSVLLNGLLHLPYLLISLRNALLTTSPFALPPSPPTQAAVLPPPASISVPLRTTTRAPLDPDGPREQEQAHESGTDTGSEADIESNSGDVSSVEGSWVSLQG